MDVLTLRTELETVLADHLGEYTLANGAKTPAISVRAAGESLSPNTTATGLEVVILREPELVPVRQYVNEQAFSRWTVYLVDWTGHTNLQELGGLLIAAYPGSNTALVNVPKGVGPKSQLRIEFQTNPEA